MTSRNVGQGGGQAGNHEHRGCVRNRLCGKVHQISVSVGNPSQFKNLSPVCLQDVFLKKHSRQSREIVVNSVCDIVGKKPARHLRCLCFVGHDSSPNFEDV